MKWKEENSKLLYCFPAELSLTLKLKSSTISWLVPFTHIQLTICCFCFTSSVSLYVRWSIRISTKDQKQQKIVHLKVKCLEKSSNYDWFHFSFCKGIHTIREGDEIEYTTLDMDGNDCMRYLIAYMYIKYFFSDLNYLYRSMMRWLWSWVVVFFALWKFRKTSLWWNSNENFSQLFQVSSSLRRHLYKLQFYMNFVVILIHDRDPLIYNQPGRGTICNERCNREIFRLSSCALGQCTHSVVAVAVAVQYNNKAINHTLFNTVNYTEIRIT